MAKPKLKTDVPAELTKYAAAGNDVVGLAARVVDVLRAAFDPTARARRLRRRAARVLRRGHLTAADGRTARATALRAKAAALWSEAAELDGAESPT